MARTNRDRVHQVAKFLRVEFPTIIPVEVRVEKIDYPRRRTLDGAISLTGKRLLLRVDPRQKRGAMIETLLHEWAHARNWTSASFQHGELEHPDDWGLEYVKIYRCYVDEGGDIKSREYPW